MKINKGKTMLCFFNFYFFKNSCIFSNSYLLDSSINQLRTPGFHIKHIIVFSFNLPIKSLKRYTKLTTTNKLLNYNTLEGV